MTELYRYTPTRRRRLCLTIAALTTILPLQMPLQAQTLPHQLHQDCLLTTGALYIRLLPAILARVQRDLVVLECDE